MINKKLTELDFTEVKSNLAEYMQSKENTLDFDWTADGSVANTVLDLLAYNTMYYAFYSNMLINESFLDTAQRLDSIISLSKPLDTELSHRLSASATLNLVNNSSSTITMQPYKTTFTGVAPNGLTYVFYYTGGATNEVLDPDFDRNQSYNQVDVAPDETISVTVYQGQRVYLNVPATNFDYTNQYFSINDKSMDPRTLRVYVQETSDGTKQYYKTIQQADTTASSRVYTLSTTQKGYNVFFGGEQSSSGSYIGRGVGPEETVYYSYVSTSGTVVNGAQKFKSGSLLQVKNPNVIARGGYSTLDTETARFMAIRGGKAHNDRLVTVSDFLSYILDLGKINTNPKKPNANISVYGSPESAEKTSGTIYWSAYDQITGIIPSTSSVVTDIVSDIEDKVMAGLKFEYKAPTEINWTITLVDKTQLSKLYAQYQTGFNSVLVGSDIGWSAAAFSITKIASTQTKFDIKNPLSTLVVTVLKDGTNQEATLSGGNLVVDGTTIGTYSLTAGTISLDSTTFTSLVSITGTADPTQSNLNVAKHENLATIAGN